MRVIYSQTVGHNHPAIEEQLWGVAVRCKEADPDIKLMGLHVSLRSSTPTHWAGQAFPEEETYLLRPRGLIIHPAGRITMSVGAKVTYTSIVRLFAHELRHIGQFHRGRRLYGYLTDEWLDENQVEPDACEFEETILQRMKYSRSRCY